MDGLTEKVLRRELLYEGKIVRLERLDVELPDGARAKREVVHHNGGAGILPLDAQGNVVLVRQYRIALGRETLEIPAGKLEKDEDARVCVVRELEEETGLVAGHVEHWCSFYPTVGYCDELLHVYLATELLQKQAHLDADEFVAVVRVPLARFVEMAVTGEIQDGKTLVAALQAALRFGISIAGNSALPR